MGREGEKAGQGVREGKEAKRKKTKRRRQRRENQLKIVKRTK